MTTKFGQKVHLLVKFYSTETNQAGVGHFITSRLHDELKPYLHCKSDYGHQTSQEGNLP